MVTAIIIYLFILIGIPVWIFIVQKSRGRNRMVKVSRLTTDGTIVKKEVKLGWSWTVFFFGFIALAVRGQIFEAIFSFFLSIFTGGMLNYYYVALANRDRLRNMVIMGWTIDDVSENGETSLIYQYIGIIKPVTTTAEATINKETHNPYVDVKAEEVDEYKYLSIADIKLLLRNNGIEFDPSASKDELVKLAKKKIK